MSINKPIHEQIDAALNVAPTGVGWGTTNIPKSQWIDPELVYVCEDNKRIVGLHLVLCNSNGNEVTYPIKGTVIVREKPLKTEYRIWSLDGNADVVWGDKQSYNLKLSTTGEDHG